MRQLKNADSAVVYTYQGEHYVAFLGGDSEFSSKDEIFLTGKEEEVFTVERPAGGSLMDLTRALNNEAYSRGIKELHGLVLSVPIKGSA